MKRVLMATAAFVMILPPATASAKGYKKIDKGVGNCIFSTSPLPKDQEDEYKVSSSFKEGDVIYARCYFPKSVKDFAKDEGKMRNSLRQPVEATMAAQAEGPSWYGDITWSDDPKWNFRTRFPYVESETGGWEQQRFDLPLGTERGDACDWHMGKFNKPQDCVDLATETRNLGENLHKTGTYTTEVCIDVSFKKVDKTRFVVGEGDVEVIESHPMARGCFKYSVEMKP